jgi:hypothetical protein
MAHINQAIAHYHDLLTPEVAAESQEQMEQMQKKWGMFFGTRPLCSVLRPRFLSREQYRFLQYALASIMPAFKKATQAALADTVIRKQLMLADWEEELIRFDPGYKAAVPLARMDEFYLPETGALAMTEYNAEVPAAPAYNALLTELFTCMPIMREFEKRYEVMPLHARHHTLNVLHDCYRQWGGKGKPRIGILDWKEVPTYSEFIMFRDFFISQGYECEICDPREVEYKDGKLHTPSGFEITLIYKRVLWSEWVERGGLDQPSIQAVRDNAVCVVNPPRCKLMHKKSSLAMLSDERNMHLFSANDLQAINSYIPWTRIVEERKTQIAGRGIDLVTFISDNKDQLVLKPNDDYGGKGVILGWTVDQTTWDSMIKAYLKEPAIVQQRVGVPSEPYPSYIDGTLHVIDRMLDTDPYLFYGTHMSGCLTRLSTAALLNVTSGGGSTVPTVIVEER